MADFDAAAAEQCLTQPHPAALDPRFHAGRRQAEPASRLGLRDSLDVGQEQCFRVAVRESADEGDHAARQLRRRRFVGDWRRWRFLRLPVAGPVQYPCLDGAAAMMIDDRVGRDPIHPGDGIGRVPQRIAMLDEPQQDVAEHVVGRSRVHPAAHVAPQVIVKGLPVVRRVRGLRLRRSSACRGNRLFLAVRHR